MFLLCFSLRIVGYCWKRSLESFGVNSIGKEPSIKSPKLALESRTFGAVGINEFLAKPLSYHCLEEDGLVVYFFA